MYSEAEVKELIRVERMDAEYQARLNEREAMAQELNRSVGVWEVMMWEQPKHRQRVLTMRKDGMPRLEVAPFKNEVANPVITWAAIK